LNKLKAIADWLAAAWHVWLCAGVIIAAMVFCLQPRTPEPVIRLTGLVLQLLGIGTVIWGISATRALFGRPSVMQKIQAWLQSFPMRRSVVIEATGIGSLGRVSVRGRAHGTYSAGPNPTIESRLDALERNIDAIHERITHAQAEADKELGNVTERIICEQHVRESADNAIREKLESTGTGGVHISAIGAAWLFVGVILSTAGVEIAGALG
jgi:hypothetical protein